MRLRWSVASLIMVTASVVHAQMPSTTRVPARGGDLVISALGHASVQIEHGATVVIVDPVSGQANLSGAKQADLILVTDIHPDHFDPAAVAKLRKPGAPVVVPQAVADTQKIPDTIVMANRQMRTNEAALAGITVISVPAYNIQRGPAQGQVYHPQGRGQGTYWCSPTSWRRCDRTRLHRFMWRATPSAYPRLPRGSRTSTSPCYR